MNMGRGSRNWIQGEDSGKWIKNWKKLNRRHTPRLVVPEGTTISVTLEFDDGTIWPAKCLNISLGGILVQFPPRHIPKVNIDWQVLLTLTLESEIVSKVPGVVRHCTKCLIGILLSEPSTRTAEQEGHLCHMILTVEREVLRQIPMASCDSFQI